MTLQALLDRYFAPVPRLRWVTVRLLMAAFCACYCVARFRVLTDFSRFARERFAPTGLVMLIDAPVPHVVSVAVVLVTILCALLFALGRAPRVTGPLLALSFLWVTSYRNSWGMLFHTENLLALHLVIFAFGTLLLDRDQARTDDVGDDDAMVDGFPLRLMSAITTVTYVLAGVAKLRNSGADWLDGEILRNYIAFDCLRKAELASAYSSLGALMVQQSALFQPLAWSTMVLELGAPLAFTHRYVRYGWVAMAWSFHMGVQLIMWIGFPYPLSLIAYASLLPVEKLWKLPGLTHVMQRFGPRMLG